MKDTLMQFVRLGLIIPVVGFMLFWVDKTWFAAHRVPRCEQATLPAGRMCLETLRQQYGEKIVWVDARSQSDFELNHLMLGDNRMFPIRQGEDKEQLTDAAMERMRDAHERGECIVVFCKGDCGAAEEIAKHLRTLGLIDAPIYTLEGGWDALKAAGMPTF